MKRILILLSEKTGNFSEVDLNWSGLVKALRVQVQQDPTEARRKGLVMLNDSLSTPGDWMSCWVRSGDVRCCPA